MAGNSVGSGTERGARVTTAVIRAWEEKAWCAALDESVLNGLLFEAVTET